MDAPTGTFDPKEAVLNWCFKLGERRFIELTTLYHDCGGAANLGNYHDFLWLNLDQPIKAYYLRFLSAGGRGPTKTYHDVEITVRSAVDKERAGLIANFRISLMKAGWQLIDKPGKQT